MEAFARTLVLVIASSLMAMTLGWVYALLCERCSGRSRPLWRLIPICAVCLPLFVHATAWEATLGKFGWLQISATLARSNLFAGAVACCWIHGVYGACWVAVLVGFVLSKMRLPEEDAALLDTGLVRYALAIVLPGTWPILSLAGLWVALIAGTEISVVDVYGFRTLADEVYFHYALSDKPLPILMSTLLPAVIALGVVLIGVTQFRRFQRPLMVHLTSGEQALPTISSWASILVLTVIAAMFVALPLASLFVKAGWQVQRVDGVLVPQWSFSLMLKTLTGAWKMFGTEFQWTGMLALTCVAMTVPLAYLLSLVGRAHRLVMTVGCLALLLIPGPVVSVVVMKVFAQHPEGFLRTLYDQTLIPSALCILYRSVPICCFIFAGHYWMTGRRVDEAAQVDGARWLTRIWLIEIPQLLRPLGLCVFAAAMVSFAEISATELVIPPGVSTVARRVFGLLHSGVRYQESGLCLLSCGIVISVVFGIQTALSVIRKRSTTL